MFKELADILPLCHQNGERPAGSRFALGSPFNFLSLIEEWRTIVGERLAEHTIPLKHTGGILTILSKHPAWGQQLSFMEPVLIKKITAAFPVLGGKLRRIKFQTDAAFFEQKKGLHCPEARPLPEKHFHPFSPRYKQLKREAQKSFAGVDDPELLRCLTSLYIQNEAKG